MDGVISPVLVALPPTEKCPELCYPNSERKRSAREATLTALYVAKKTAEVTICQLEFSSGTLRVFVCLVCVPLSLISLTFDRGSHFHSLILDFRSLSLLSRFAYFACWLISINFLLLLINFLLLLPP